MKPQQNSKSTRQLMSLSARDGSVFFVFVDASFVCDGPDAAFGEADGAASSSSSSSSMTNCAALGSTSCSGSSSTTSRFQKTSNSSLLESISNSNTTGNTRCNSRRQLSTSLVAFRSFELAPLLINEVAKEVTEVFVAVGNV